MLCLVKCSNNFAKLLRLVLASQVQSSFMMMRQLTKLKMLQPAKNNTGVKKCAKPLLVSTCNKSMICAKYSGPSKSPIRIVPPDRTAAKMKPPNCGREKSIIVRKIRCFDIKFFR